MNHSSQNLSRPHKFSKQFLAVNNLDPTYFNKTHPKIIHKLGMSQLALQSTSPQILRKLTHSLKKIKFLRVLRLRLGKCHSKDLKNVINQLKAFKNIYNLKVDLFGFKSTCLDDLMTLPRKLHCGRKLKELNVDFSSSQIPQNIMCHLLCRFLKFQSSLTSLHSKFQTLDIFQERDLTLLSESLQKRASLLKDLKLGFGECYSINGKGLFELIARGFSKLLDLKRLSLDLKECCPSDDFGLGGPNLMKTKNLVCLDLNLLRFQGLSTKDVKLLAMQFRDWSLCLRSLIIKLPSIEEKDFEIFADGLGELRSLRIFKLFMSSQDGSPHVMIRSLARGLERLEAIEELRLKLKDMKLQNKDLGILADIIKEKESLKYLKLSFARSVEITKKGLDELFYSLKELTQLEDLDLNLKGCKVTSSSIEKLAARVETLRELKTFKLCINNLEGDGILGPLFAKDQGSMLNTLTASLSKLPNLSAMKLKLFYIEITGKNLMKISEDLRKMKSLKKLTLYFDCNAMDLTLWRVGFNILFYGLKEISTLTDLSINIERTDNSDLQALFTQLKGWSNLKSLFLGLYRGEIINEETAREFYEAMKTLGGGLKNFAMYFYWGAHIQAGAALEMLKGVGELRCIENLEFDLVNTTMNFIGRDRENNLLEFEERLLEKLVNMKSLKKLYYMDEQVV